MYLWQLLVEINHVNYSWKPIFAPFWNCL